MTKGDIILVPFPFTDLSAVKRRPCVVLIARKRDVTVAFVSTQLKDDAYAISLTPSESNGLKAKSELILSKIATLDRKTVIGKIGNLNADETRRVNQKLTEILQLNDNLNKGSR